MAKASTTRRGLGLFCGNAYPQDHGSGGHTGDIAGSVALTGCGGALILIGGFFLALRPPLMPEDARFMGATAETILGAVPLLGVWLRRVFWVLGAYIATMGVLVVYIASTGVRTGSVGDLAVIAVAGVTSIGWMSVVNFIIRSDFRWVLLGLDSVSVLGLALGAATR